MLNKDTLEKMLSDLFYETDDIDPNKLNMSGAEATAWNYLIDCSELSDHNDYGNRDFEIAFELSVALVEQVLNRFKEQERN